MSFSHIFIRLLIICFVFLSAFAFSEEHEEIKPVVIPELPLKEEAAPLEQGETFKGPKESYEFSTNFSRYFNAIDITGYVRGVFNYWRDAHLRTYIKDSALGTSRFTPELSAYAQDSEGAQNPHQNNVSAALKARINPTINITELTRLRTSFDIGDLVLGSSAHIRDHQASILSLSQKPIFGGIALRRVWGEANFPIGELRFGRMPFHWGLGILYNSGDIISDDYDGDSIDGIMFTTRVLDHLVSPSYSIAYTGPVGSSGGKVRALESSDLAHVLSLSILKRDSDFVAQKKREQSKILFNYGLFSSYRTQHMDSYKLTSDLIRRDAHVALGSWWMAFSYKTFYIETEFAGLWGSYRVGEKKNDPMALAPNGDVLSDQRHKLLQGGFALESKYGFLDDRLQLGLDFGLASAQSGAGFGVYDNKIPKAGAFKSSFAFNPAYTVDLLLYKQVLGAISGSYYAKPHLSYFFSRNFGVRTDLLSAFALKKENTFGKSNLLGIELDASLFLRSDNGFYSSLAYGALFPLKGLNHERAALNDNQYRSFGTAQMAQTLQLCVGLTF
jgi:uncharacterized protein (TIGR04551 family)